MIEYVHKVVAERAPSGTGFTGVWRHCRKDGSLMDVEIKWCPISFGGRAASLAMINDITERKRIEHRNAALSKLGQSLSSATSPAEAAGIIRAVADELFRWDVFTLDLYSAETNRIFPVLNVDTDREARRFDIPVSGHDLEPSQMARRIIEEGAELILRDEPIIMPEEAGSFADTPRPSASLMLVPIRNRTKVIGLLSIQSYRTRAYDQADLSTLQTLADHCGGALERIGAEHALRDSEQRFRELFEGSPDAVFVEDLEGTVLDINPAACRLHGATRQDLIGKNVLELVPPER
jgi:PAS domain-containing protein